MATDQEPLMALRRHLQLLECSEALGRKLATLRWAGENRSLAADFACISELLVQHHQALAGAATAIFEDGRLLAQGGCHLPPLVLKALEGLWGQEYHKQSPGRWVEIGGLVPAWGGRDIRALPLSPNEVGQGVIFADFDHSDVDHQLVLEALERTADQLALAVVRSVRDQKSRRIDALHRLAKAELDHPELDSVKLVEKLQSIFDTDVVTLLLEEHGELRLAASTDRTLVERGPVIYEQGKGLTGWVFEHKKPLRLPNTEDQVGVLRVTGLERRGPLHPECIGRQANTVRFLGVPVETGEKVRGVLRMSRFEERSHFTRQDEEALEFFANLLGIALARSWDRFITRSIEESRLVAIAVSRRRKLEGGSKVPSIVWANLGAADILGYPCRSELYGKDARKIYAPGEYGRIKQRLNSALKGGEYPASREFGTFTRVQRVDGSFRYIQVSFHLLVDSKVQPPIYYTVGIARDTTKSLLRKDQHYRLMKMLDDMNIVYFRADTEGRTLESSEAEQRITGYSAAELAALDRNRLYCDLRSRQDLIHRAREHGGRMVDFRQVLRRKDGSEFWALGALRTLQDQNGQETGVEGLYRDVTDRLKLQSFIDAPIDRVLLDDELFVELKRNAEFQLDYQTSLGHQLLTPLVSLVENLRNFEKLLPLDSRPRERIPYILGQARVCARLVRNLSFMDKILRGESFKKTQISLAKLSIETKLDFLHLLQEEDMRLEIDDSSLDRYLRIEGHCEMMRQVIVNLVDNAIKYSARGSTIVIRGAYLPEGRTFEITNHGLPLPEETQGLFKRGFRSSKAKMLVPHGTGLGLWLVRRIAEAHGAQVRCLKVYDRQQTRNLFRITFPHQKRRVRARAQARRGR